VRKIALKVTIHMQEESTKYVVSIFYCDARVDKDLVPATNEVIALPHQAC